MIGCDCQVCLSSDSRNKRFRSSILVESRGVNVVVDTTPDFRMQCLRSRLRNIDAIVYTHEHFDHLLGLDEMRRFCVMHDKRLPAYGSAKVLDTIRRVFPYAVHHPPPYKGLPEIDLHEINGPFSIQHLRLIPFAMPHGSTQTLGFRFDDERGPRFAYLTDCKTVDTSIRRELKGIPMLILDALRKTSHPTHLSLNEALEIVKEIQPEQAYFTHICHEMEHHATNEELPKNVRLAYDGQVFEV